MVITISDIDYWYLLGDYYYLRNGYYYFGDSKRESYLPVSVALLRLGRPGKRAERSA